MRLDDYRKDLDSIHCTPEFKAKMREQLSKAPEEGYADSVTEVEPARKISFTRYAAVAAAGVVAIGLGTAAAINLKSGVDPMTDPSDTAVTATAVFYDEYDSSTGEFNEYRDLGNISSEAVEEFFYAVENYFVKADLYKPEMSGSNADPDFQITINFSGTDGLNSNILKDEPFTLTANNHELCTIEQGGETYYFFNDSYHHFMHAFSYNLDTADWDTILYIDELKGVFNKYAPSFELYHPEEDERILGSSAILLTDQFNIFASLENDLIVSFNCFDGMDHTVYLKTAEGFGRKVYDIVFSGQSPDPVEYDENSCVDTESLVNYVRDICAENNSIGFSRSTGQYGYNYLVCTGFDAEKILTAISHETFTATKIEGEDPYQGSLSKDFYHIGSLVFGYDGKIYDSYCGVLYTPDGLNMDIENAIVDTITSDPDCQAAYIMAVGPTYMENMTADIEANMTRFNPVGGENGISSGKGKLWYRSGEIAPDAQQYITISDPDYTAEFIQKEGKLAIIERGDRLSQFYPGATSFEKDSEGRKVDCRVGYSAAGNEILLDLDNLREYAMYVIQDCLNSRTMDTGCNVEYFEVTPAADVDSTIHVRAKYSYEYHFVEADFTIDQYGNPIRMDYSSTYRMNDEETTTVINVTIGDGKPENINYNDSGFALPQLTEEQQTFFDMPRE